jgi:hypothetical protein
MTHLETKANEKSSYVISITTNFTPTVGKWTLVDEDETVVNSRSSVAIGSLSTAMTVTLTSDDLAISDSQKTRRYFTAYGTYNGGVNTWADGCSFDIDDLMGHS